MPDPIVDLDKQDNKPAKADKVAAAEPVAAEPTARDKVRAWEDENLGPDVPRVSGEIERGVGSKYALLIAEKPAKGAQYEALQKLVKAEDDMVKAQASMDHAKVEIDVATKALDDANAAVSADGPAKPE